MPDEIAEFHNEVVLLHQSASINSLAHILLVQSPHKLPLILEFRELTLDNPVQRRETGFHLSSIPVKSSSLPNAERITKPNSTFQMLLLHQSAIMICLPYISLVQTPHRLRVNLG